MNIPLRNFSIDSPQHSSRSHSLGDPLGSFQEYDLYFLMQELLRSQEEREKNDFQLFACRIFNESFSRFGPLRHITIIILVRVVNFAFFF